MFVPVRNTNMALEDAALSALQGEDTAASERPHGPDWHCGTWIV
jgi:hypothetical protein